MAFFGPATPFPSLWALIPVLGTALVLLAASPNTHVGRLLSTSSLVGIGLISYSAYLWHQPLLAFARMLHSEQDPQVSLMVLLGSLSLPLAWVSWVTVERPFRRKGFLSRRFVFTASGLGGVILAGTGAFSIWSGGLINRYAEPLRPLLAESPLTYGEYVRGAYTKVKDKLLLEGSPGLILVGDSFSQDIFNVLSETGVLGFFDVSAIYIPTKCQLHYGVPEEQSNQSIAPADVGMCASRALNQSHIDRMRSAEVVIFAARWESWAAQRFAESLNAMALGKDQRVFVVGPKYFEPNRRKLLNRVEAVGIKARIPIDPSVASVNSVLMKSLPASNYVDVIGAICKQGCPLLTPTGELISYDGRHLTRAGAKFVGAQLLAQTPLADLRSAEVVGHLNQALPISNQRPQ